jgi:hypothetical protein
MQGGGASIHPGIHGLQVGPFLRICRITEVLFRWWLSWLLSVLKVQVW